MKKSPNLPPTTNRSLLMTNNVFFSLSKAYKCCCESQQNCCWDSCPTNETVPLPDACGLENIHNPAYHNVHWEDIGDGVYSLKAIKGLPIIHGPTEQGRFGEIVPRTFLIFNGNGSSDSIRGTGP